VGHPTALRHATRSDQDQKDRSRYVDLFLEEGKAEAVLADDGFRRLRAMLSSGIPPKAAESFVQSASRPGRLTAGLNYYRANLSREDRWGILDPDVTIPMPTVLMWGDHDPALGRFQAEDTARYVAGNYRLDVLEGAGHWLQFERPDEVGRTLVNAVSK
jgi:pimeloyl-ACP methyl ester carboxylesterase